MWRCWEFKLCKLDLITWGWAAPITTVIINASIKGKNDPVNNR